MAQKKVTIDGLAVMVQSGFNEIDKRFDKVDDRLNLIEGRLDAIENELISV